MPPDSFERWSKVNLNEADSCPWVTKRLLKLYRHCLKSNWFFMHKLETSIFRKSNKLLLRKYARFCCKLSRRILKERINQGKLSLPLIFWIIYFYFIGKGFMLKLVHKVYKKVFLKQ